MLSVLDAFADHTLGMIQRKGAEYLKWLNIKDFTNFTAAHFVAKCHVVNSLQNPISDACAWDSIISVHYPQFITIGEDWNQDWFKNWQFRYVWKLSFCDHRMINLTQNCIYFTNPCINHHLLSLITTTLMYILVQQNLLSSANSCRSCWSFQM